MILTGREHTRLNHLACAQLLLELGADACFHQPGAPRDTLLSKAMLFSPAEMAALLVQYGAKLSQACLSDGESIAKRRPDLAAKIREAGMASLDFISQIEAIDADYGSGSYFAKKSQ